MQHVSTALVLGGGLHLLLAQSWKCMLRCNGRIYHVFVHAITIASKPADTAPARHADACDKCTESHDNTGERRGERGGGPGGLRYANVHVCAGDHGWRSRPRHLVQFMARCIRLAWQGRQQHAPST